MVYFQTKNPNLGNLWGGLGIENVGLFYDHLEYFTVIWYNFWPFGTVCGHFVYFSNLVCLDQENLATLILSTIYLFVLNFVYFRSANTNSDQN
jgi:hypothetical protein